MQREIVEWVLKLNQRELSIRPSMPVKKGKPSENNTSGFSGILTQRECVMPLGGDNSLSTIRKSALASSQRKKEGAVATPLSPKNYWQQYTTGLGGLEEMYLQIIHLQAS